MPVLATTKDFVENVFGPWLFMSFSIALLPKTIFQLIRAGKFRALFSFSELSSANFGNFWAIIGPTVKSEFKPNVIPLLEGRVRDGVIHDDVVNPAVSGIVLEIGAGSGMWTDVFASIAGRDLPKDTGEKGDGYNLRRRTAEGTTGTTAPAPGITKIYGVEPNPTSVKALRKRVTEFGLDGTYQVIPVGIEQITDPDAWEGNIEEGTVDSVVCICCLCSIPEPEKNIRLLYKLLKPGGRWYVHEHVQTDRGFFIRWYQCK
jgi:SAM-dependent methyltransferase